MTNGPANASRPWRIGVLFSATGVTAAVETSQRGGTLLAIDEINASGGVLGRPVEAIVYDPASDPKSYRRYAEKLLGEDGVRLIFGCYMSSTRKAILPVVEAYRGLLFYPTLYEGFEYSAPLRLHRRGAEPELDPARQVPAEHLRQPLLHDRLELRLPLRVEPHHRATSSSSRTARCSTRSMCRWAPGRPISSG